MLVTLVYPSLRCGGVDQVIQDDERRRPMRVAKEDVNVKMQIPGAVIRQRTDFGDASGYGKISGEYFTLAAGVNTMPLFRGLEGNLCQSPHWGFVLSGQITTTDATGTEETVGTHDLFYWPPGHNVKVDADAEIIMFSPQHEHSQVIDHMIDMTSGQG
jgi:hypothetical protein